MMWNICEIHICTAVVDESEEWSSQYIFQFKRLEGRSLKNIRASTGFKPVTSAIPVRCSTNWPTDQLMITVHFHLQPQYNMNFIYISLYVQLFEFFVMISVISFRDFSLFPVPLFKWFNSCFHSYQFPLSFTVNRRMLTCIKPDLL